MAREFKLPELGEDIESGRVVGVLVSAGDEVQAEQGLVEVETDKATIEVPSPRAGTIAEVRVKEGDEVKVDQVLVTFEEEGAEPASGGEEERRGQPSAEDGREEHDQEEAEEGGEPPEADRRQEERGGRDEEADSESEDEERRREPARAGAEERASTPERRAASGSTSSSSNGEKRRRSAPAAPSVRRFAREIGVDVDDVEGSGPEGRISFADVKAYARRVLDGGATAPGASRTKSGRSGARADGTERQELGKIRRASAERLARAWSTIPHVTLDTRADVTEVEVVRQRYRQRARSSGGHLTMTTILAKIAGAALEVFPRVNSRLDPDGEALVRNPGVHVGVAVDTEEGLLVPVLRDVPRKSILELARELKEKIDDARAGELRTSSGTRAGITVTNLGKHGITSFSPIINPPELVILGVGRATSQPVYVEGELEPRLLLPLSLSFDHRALDGADAARFLEWIVKALEDPLVLAMEA